MCKLQFASVLLECRGSHFSVGLDLLSLSGHIGDNASHMFVPVLVDLTDGARRLELPSVLVAGRRRYRAFRWFMRWFGCNLLRANKIKKY